MRDRPLPVAMTVPAHPKPRWFALPLLALGVVGFAAAWMLVALGFGGMLAWLAPLAAADMVLLLALSRWPAGRSRALIALIATALTIVLAAFCTIAAQVGLGMGLRPWESVSKLGPAYAWELARLAMRPSDWAGYVAGLLVAGWTGFSARRRAPSAR